MTIKEYNRIRTAIFAEAAKIPEVEKALAIDGVAYIYEAVDATRQHTVLTLTAKTQLNDNTLRAAGIDPSTATCRLQMTLRQTTKCAELSTALI